MEFKDARYISVFFDFDKINQINFIKNLNFFNWFN